jgi:hypothetical protein
MIVNYAESCWPQLSSHGFDENRFKAPTPNRHGSIIMKVRIRSLNAIPSGNPMYLTVHHTRSNI